MSFCTGLIAASGDNPYSSYMHHPFGTDDAVITAHPYYLEPTHDPTTRRQTYRNLFTDRIGGRSTKTCLFYSDPVLLVTAAKSAESHQYEQGFRESDL